jgi:hypothetical protein
MPQSAAIMIAVNKKILFPLIVIIFRVGGARQPNPAQSPGISSRSDRGTSTHY